MVRTDYSPARDVGGLNEESRHLGWWTPRHPYTVTSLEPWYPPSLNMPDYGQWLLVAPRTNLPYSDAEVMEIVSSLHAEILIGNITAMMLQRALYTPRRGVWFVMHGNEQGIELSDGLLSVNLLLPMLEAASPQIVYLNSCKSLELGLILQQRLRCAFVTNVQEVPDQEAFISGTAFAHQLSTGRSFYAAYASARPGANTNLVFLPSGEEGVKPVAGSGIPPSEDVRRLLQEVQRLAVLIDGDPRYNVTGLKIGIQALNDSVVRLGDKMEVLESRQITVNIVTGVVVVLLIIFFLALQAVIARGG